MVLPGLDLQLDVTDDFLCHCSLLLRVRTPARLATAGLLACLPVRTTRSGGCVALQGRLQPSLQARVRPSRPGRIPVPRASNARKSAPPRAGGSFRSEEHTSELPVTNAN